MRTVPVCAVTRVALAILIAVAVPLSVHAQTQEPRLAVLPFAGDWSLADVIANRVEEGLFRTGRFTLIDRRALAAVLQEQGLGAADLADPRTAAQVGRLTGVQYLVLGRTEIFETTYAGEAFGVSIYRNLVRLSARVVDTQNAEIVAIAHGTGETRGSDSSRQMNIALDRAVADLVAGIERGLQDR